MLRRFASALLIASSVAGVVMVAPSTAYAEKPNFFWCVYKDGREPEVFDFVTYGGPAGAAHACRANGGRVGGVGT